MSFLSAKKKKDQGRSAHKLLNHNLTEHFTDSAANSAYIVPVCVSVPAQSGWAVTSF